MKPVYNKFIHTNQKKNNSNTINKIYIVAKNATLALPL